MTTSESPITRSILREELADMRGEFSRHYATKADLAELETRLIKWMVGAIVTSTLIWASLVATIDRLIG